MLLKKKFNRTKKPKNQDACMFAQLGFSAQTYFIWANDNVFKTINTAKNETLFI